jgi:hypothetical protein
MAQMDYEIQGNYNNEWETVNTETTREAAQRSYQEYLHNEKGTPFRIRRVRREN